MEERDAWYVAWFEEPGDPEAFVDGLPRALETESGLPGIRIETAWQAHEEWAESWKRGLGERRLTERVVVRPSWIEPSDVREGDLEVVLDPGMAFGTAEHGTTRGCLRLLDKAVHTGQRLLDVGAGSGILSIAAALLGARHTLALEGDALALEALAENVERNEVTDRVEWREVWADPELLADLGPVDGVLANIESGILRPLIDGFARALPTQGWLILSGILGEEWDGMRRATEAYGFRLREVDEDGMWRSGWFVRMEDPKP